MHIALVWIHCIELTKVDRDGVLNRKIWYSKEKKEKSEIFNDITSGAGKGVEEWDNNGNVEYKVGRQWCSTLGMGGNQEVVALSQTLRESSLNNILLTPVVT